MGLVIRKPLPDAKQHSFNPLEGLKNRNLRKALGKTNQAGIKRRRLSWRARLLQFDGLSGLLDLPDLFGHLKVYTGRGKFLDLRQLLSN